MAEKLIDNQWIDIVLPPAPESDLLFWTICFVVAVLIISCLLLLLWSRQPQQRLQRCIRAVQHQLPVSTDYKKLLMQIETALCTFHRLPYLYPAPHVPRHWQRIFDDLTHIRYRRQQPDTAQTQQLIQQCRDLLKQTGNTRAG